MNKIIHQMSIVYLACIILLRMMAMPLSLIDYTLHKGYITAYLCENRLKPEMHCAGGCFLNKKLKMANESQESRNQKGTGKIIVVDFFEPVHGPAFRCTGVVPEYKTSFNVQPISSPYTGNIFHPPIT
jgi:hypothetical protein